MEPVLEVSDLNKRFGAVVAASDVNISVERGEILGIIGANGAGKTTFVNMVTGYLKPTSGRIRFLGRDITGLPPRQVTRLGMCRSFQVSQVFMSETVFENVLVAFGIAESTGLGVLSPLLTPERVTHVEAHLQRYRIDDYRDTRTSSLPQGVRKLLDIAMATVRRPAILLLDEPTSGISVEEKFELMDIIMMALREDETTVLFVEHDMEIVARYVSRVVAFYQGEVICDEPPELALVDPRVREFVIGEPPKTGIKTGINAASPLEPGDA